MFAAPKVYDASLCLIAADHPTRYTQMCSYISDIPNIRNNNHFIVAMCLVPKHVGYVYLRYIEVTLYGLVKLNCRKRTQNEQCFTGECVG